MKISIDTRPLPLPASSREKRQLGPLGRVLGYLLSTTTAYALFLWAWPGVWSLGDLLLAILLAGLIVPIPIVIAWWKGRL